MKPTPAPRPEPNNPAKCKDPFVSDPEGWDCLCHINMVKKCGGHTGLTSPHFMACYRSLLCKHSMVCNTWKKKACCIDDDHAVKKQSGGKYSNCAAMKDSCRDPKIGGVVQLNCPKTCRMCPFGSSNSDADVANDVDLQDTLGENLDEEEETAAAWPKKQQPKAWPKPNAWSKPKPTAEATPTPTSNPLTQRVAKQAEMCLAM